MLEWIFYLRPTQPFWNNPEDMSFTMTVRNKVVMGDSESLRYSVRDLHCRPDLTVETTVSELGSLNLKGLIRSWDVTGQVVAFNH